MYRIGLPLWKTYAKVFGKIGFRVKVNYDKTAEVFIATSPDLEGFVVEATDMEELLHETNDVSRMLIAKQITANPGIRPIML